MLRRKIGNAGELERLAVGEGVADLDRTVVVNADDVAGIDRFHIGLNLEGEAGEGFLVRRDCLEVYFLDFLISFSYEEIDGG